MDRWAPDRRPIVSSASTEVLNRCGTALLPKPTHLSRLHRLGHPAQPPNEDYRSRSFTVRDPKGTLGTHRGE